MKKILLYFLVTTIIISFTNYAQSNKPEPMPVISRGVPAYASIGHPSYANDDNYNSFWQNDGGSLPGWLAYDLSTVPAVQRQQVLVSWWNDVWAFYSGNQVRVPMLYTIDVHAGAGGSTPPASDDAGWITLVNVDTSEFKARMHLVNLTNENVVYNWIRIYITACNDDSYGIRINMDIHDAHLGSDDSWFFAGNSITAEGMRPKITGDLNFSQIVNEALPDYLPATINAGISGWRSDHGAEHIPQWVQMFPCHFVTLNYGTNDSGYGTSDEDFYNNFETMVLAVLNAGKVPVIPTIPWLPIEKSANRIEELNIVLDSLKADYPEIIDGPDFWKYFSEHQYLFDPDDNIHPSPAAMLIYRRMWAEKMLETVYGVQPPSIDRLSPAVVEGLNAAILDDDSIKLTWQESADNVFAYYLVYLNGTQYRSTANTSYTVNDLLMDTTYTFSIVAFDAAGNIAEESESIDVIIPSVTSIDNEITWKSLEFKLYQNYPNPFNPTTTINYQLPQNGNVILKIYDILGREVITLVNEEKVAGNYAVQWNGNNSNGQIAGSGVYIYQLNYNGNIVTKRMSLLK